MYDMKPLILKFRNNRKRLGINQKEFASRLGISLATITRWERGNMIYTPDLRQLSLIADMFETTVWELLTPDTLGNVTNDETQITTESITTDVESTTQEASPIVTNEKTAEEQPATPIVTSDDAQETPSFINPDETLQETAANEAKELVNTDEITEASADVPEDTSPDQTADIVIHDEQISDQEAPSMELPEPFTSDETPETPLSVTNNETLQEIEDQEISTNDELSHEAQIPTSSAGDEIIEPPTDAPENTSLDQAPDVVMPDEQTLATDSISSVITDETIPEASSIVTSDETAEEQTTPQIINIDESPAEDSPSQELFSIIPHDENQTEAEPISSEAETTTSEAQSIITHDKVAEEQPSEAITAPDDIAESVTIDEAAQSELPSVIPDETSEGQATAPIITPDDIAESVTNDEISIEGNTAPELFSIITPDETKPSTDVSTSDTNDGQENPTPDIPAIDANAETSQEATATEAPVIVKADEVNEALSDTSSELTTDKQTKPWEALGMSRAWYYRLRQRGQLDEYLKEKNK